MKAPYLSLVVTTSNDSYGNLASTQSKCLSLLQRQLEDRRIDSEIVIVAYNPAAGSPPLGDCLSFDAGGRHTTIRVVTVPSRYHDRFRFAEVKRFHQAFAINIGVRRTRGEYVVIRATDHVYSDALVDWLGERRLSDGNIYRCDRVDVDQSLLEFVTPDRFDGVSELCTERILQRHRPLKVDPWYRIPTLHTNAAGDFLLMSRRLWLKTGGWRERRGSAANDWLDWDSLVLHAARALGGRQVILPDECCVYKISHGQRTVDRVQQVWSDRQRGFERLLKESGCGPFLQNVARGIFNYPKRRDLTVKDVLLPAFERRFLMRAQLWAHGYPFIRQNRGAWGLRDEELPEAVLVRAAWDTE
jgi:hypothetical protein